MDVSYLLVVLGPLMLQEGKHDVSLSNKTAMSEICYLLLILC